MAHLIPTKASLNKIVLITVLCVFFLLILKPVQRNAFNFPLRDEEDNIVTGTWVFHGKKLYSNIFFQRQPLPTILSGAIQEATKPNTIYLLIKRHREFILFYSFFWIILLTLRFGSKGLLVGITLEFTKFTLLGNLYHAESLVVYPIVFVIGLIYELNKNKKTSFWDIYFFPVLLLFILFSRETLIPFVILSFVLVYVRLELKKRKVFIFSVAITFILYMLLFFPFVSFPAFFKTTIPVNFFDFIPSEVHYSWHYVLISIFFLPFKLLLYPNSNFYLIIKLFSILYFISLIYFYKHRQYKNLFISFFLLATLNFRPAEFGTFSDGRRFLPWFAGFVGIITLNHEIIFTSLKNTYKKAFAALLVTSAFLFLIVPYGLHELSIKPDPYTMWYINYSTYFDYGETIKLLSNNDDTLLAVPQQPLIYWQSQLPTSSPYFFTLRYMYERPRIFEQVKDKLRSNPPDFFYIEGSETFKEGIKDILENYVVVPKGNDQSKLLVNKNKLQEISDEKWSEVARLGFSKPNF